MIDPASVAAILRRELGLLVRRPIRWVLAACLLALPFFFFLATPARLLPSGVSMATTSSIWAGWVVMGTWRTVALEASAGSGRRGALPWQVPAARLAAVSAGAVVLWSLLVGFLALQGKASRLDREWMWAGVERPGIGVFLAVLGLLAFLIAAAARAAAPVLVSEDLSAVRRAEWWLAAIPMIATFGYEISTPFVDRTQRALAMVWLYDRADATIAAGLVVFAGYVALGLRGWRRADRAGRADEPPRAVATAGVRAAC